MITELFDATLAWIAANPGWMGLIIGLTSLSESLAIVGLFIPGVMLMFGFGALIALGHLDFWSACGWAVAGAVAGDGLSFWLGRTLHQRLRQLWPFYRYPDMLMRGEIFFRRHGGKSVLFGRFFGPVRAVTPAVAGMLDMPAGRFFLVDFVSALLWAPAYLLPGMVFATSLELAAQIAWRLVALILLVIALLWFTVWTVRIMFRLLHPRVNGWLKTFFTWSRNRPFIGPVAASLLDPTQGELRGLATFAALLLGGGIFLMSLLFASDRQIPTAFDQNLYRFLQNLRTPWADTLMVFITELGDYQVYLPLAAAVFLWLYFRGARSAALHWLAALGFGLVTIIGLKWALEIPRPVDIYQGIFSYSFPSAHVTSSTILFGFLAVLIARETAEDRRWLPYLGAALIVIPIAFSRLYLGVHWLTDTVASLSLGLAWVSLLGLAYNRHPAPHVGRRGLLLVSLAALVISDLPHVGLHYEEDVRRYQARFEIERMAKHDWWEHDWQRLPRYRIDLGGKQRQPLILQWAASRAGLQRRLLAAGWRLAPSLTLENAAKALNPHIELAELPVLPRLHDGRHDDLTLTHPGKTPGTRWVLRFWDAGVRLRSGDIPVWLGSVSLQRLERRMNFLAFAESMPDTEFPQKLLASALKGLQQRTVIPANSKPLPITLVADGFSEQTLVRSPGVAPPNPR